MTRRAAETQQTAWTSASPLQGVQPKARLRREGQRSQGVRGEEPLMAAVWTPTRLQIALGSLLQQRMHAALL